MWLPWWLRRYRVCLQCERPGFESWGGMIPWWRKWQSTPTLLPGKSHGQRILIGYSPWGRKELDTTEQLHFHFHCMLSIRINLQQKLKQRTQVNSLAVQRLGFAPSLPMAQVGELKSHKPQAPTPTCVPPTEKKAERTIWKKQKRLNDKQGLILESES